jgi:hypothetical protein
MREVVLGDVRLDFPECFEECSAELMVKLAKLGLSPLAPKGGTSPLAPKGGTDSNDDRLSGYAFWILILEAVCAFGFGGKTTTSPSLKGGESLYSRGFKRFWKKLNLAPEQLEYLIETLQWVKDRPEGKPFECFDFNGVSYYLPEARFKNTTAIEWTEGLLDFVELTAPVAFDSAQATGANAEVLDRLDCLIANFCRPVRKDLESWKESELYNGDRREPFNRARAEERAKEFKELDAGVKILVLWWYEELIQAFFEEYKDLFGSAKGGQKRYEDGRGFLMVLKNAAKKHYLGDFNGVCDNDVNVVYSLLLDDFYDENEGFGSAQPPGGGFEE